MTKLTLNPLGSGFQSTDALNDNFDLIETAVENTLSRDGSTPNQMEGDIDLNSNDLLNVKETYTKRLYVNGTLYTVGELNAVGRTKTVLSAATQGQTLFIVPEYVMAVDALNLYINGLYQYPSAFTETSTTSITFTGGLDEGDSVLVEILYE